MSTKEIHQIRRKFITVSMCSFAVVILFIGSLINFANYTVENAEIDYSLDVILEKKHDLEYDDALISELQDTFSFEELFSPSYQRHIFYIFTYDNMGREIDYSASKGNTYRDEVIQQKAYNIMSSKAVDGQSGMYFFRKNVLPNGNTELVMLDCSYIIFTRERLLYASVGVGILGLLAAFILVLMFSRKAIEPEIRNNEKQIQFLTNVSHELKTPLAVIQSNAELEEIVNGESEYTKSTIRQVNRMNGLIKSLVMISKTKEKSNDRVDTPVDVSKVANETLSEFTAMASGENKTIENDIDDNISINYDESLVRQLVMILIDNAIKYCDDNGTVKIELTKTRRLSGARLTVSNDYASGAGVDYTKFFDRFYRGDTSHNDKTSGYGMESQTTAVTNIMGMQDGSKYYLFEDNKDVPYRMSETIFLYKGDSVLTLTKKNFQKCFPDSKDAIDAWFSQHKKMDNSNVEAVMALCREWAGQ